MEKVDIQANKDNFWIKKIKLYKDIFWEEPWNEWFICKNCDKIYPKKFMWKCYCKKSSLESFYNNIELKYSFKELSLKEWYKEYVANILEEKVWFILWWNTSLNKLNNDKLWLDWDKFKALEANIIEIFPEFDIDNFYYFAEIWVKKEFRWNDIAGKLYRKNLEELQKFWEKYILVRTTRKTDVPYNWFKANWYREVFQYNDFQDRVILVKKL